MQIQTEFLCPAAALSCVAVAAFCDIRSRRVPNTLTGPAFLLGLGLHLAVGGWRQMLASLAAGLLCGAIFLIFYVAGGMGAGDVKLIAAIGCLLGFSNIAALMVLTALTGAAMAIALSVFKGRLGEMLANTLTIAVHHGRKGFRPHPQLNVRNAATLRLPYALAIASGTTLTLYFQLLQR